MGDLANYFHGIIKISTLLAWPQSLFHEYSCKRPRFTVWLFLRIILFLILVRLVTSSSIPTLSIHLSVLVYPFVGRSMRQTGRGATPKALHFAM